MPTAVVDLFCGVGGLSYGLRQAGLNVVAGIDSDPSCAFAFEANCGTPFIGQDVNKFTPGMLNELFGDAQFRILVGCAPCQPFSNYTQGADKTIDGRWQLLTRFSYLIRETLPDVVSMENVPQIARFKDAPVLDRFVKNLKALEYHVDYRVVNAADYGVPQKRKRLILLASRLGPISLIGATHSEDRYITVRRAIGRMPRIDHGEVYARDFLHRATRLNPLNLKRIQHSVPGGSWVRDWPEELIPACHKKAKRKSYGSIYGRMSWDDTSPTITTHCTGTGNGRFGHPDQDRAITLREAAMLQSFPRTYQFAPSADELNVRNIARHIGNAVPPNLGMAIGSSIINNINQFGNE